MKLPDNAITLNRKAFIQAMRQNTFSAYTVYKSGKQMFLAAENDQGTEFILGSMASQPRVWVDQNSVANFLENNDIREWRVVCEGESA
ncbi:hypothetical protein [Enterobacter soli]|uniref:hypothetical protein n=1 Tax=Enterobacter soli TaxID=885040 RepID=UPI002F3F403B